MAITKIPLLVREIQEKKVKEVNYSFEKTISYSQFSLYNKCPHSWFLNYIENPRTFSSNITTVFGTAIHNTLQKYITIHLTESKKLAKEMELPEIFRAFFLEEYTRCVKDNNGNHISSAKEMREFYEDGINILDDFKKNIASHIFKGDHLVGIEVPIIQPVHPKFPKLFMKGYIDVVLYNENSETLRIIDIKTSRMGWKKELKDEMKMNQVVLYKEYFSKQYNIDVDKIEVEYIIVKRKIYEKSEFPQKRIQKASPSSGKIKRAKLIKNLYSFIEECFTPEGEFQREKTYEKNPSTENCKYCNFNTICDKKKTISG